MLKRAITLAILASLIGAASVSAQTTTCGNTKLSCLLPTAFHTNPPTFNFFNEAFGTQIGQLPLATPASGFIFTFDKASGVYKASSESFGPLLAERSETIGRHKAYLAFTYQRFSFSEIDGNDLTDIPILFYFPSSQNPQVVTYTQNRVDTKIDQFAAFATFGVTDRIDVSLAIPFEKISMGVSPKGTEYSTTSTAQASFTEFLAGSASGIGDVVVSAKGTLLRRGRIGLAAGTELRFPSGDARNFLGSGAFGVKPYVVLSRRGRLAPHLNVGYQWNSNSPLATDQKGEERLPAFFSYAAGADIGVTKRLTVVADLMGQHFFDAPQVSTPRMVTAPVNNQQVSFSSIVLVNGSYNVNNLGVGLKANPWNHLLVTANALVKLDEGGVRATVVPLVGISYSF
jgi:hypothetical protein